MGRLVGFAAAVVAVLVLASAGGTATGDGLIVFPATPEGGGSTQLFSIAPTGTGLTQLTNGANPAIDPVFSPSGKRIAFARFGVGIFTMNPDGSGLHRVTTNGRDSTPAWSPNGRSIAFVRPLGTKWRLYVVRASGGKPRRLAQAPPAGRPSWTKAGLLVPTGGDVVRVDVKTGRVLKYYDASIDAIWGLNSVSVSPNVSQLTYVGSREPEAGDMECGEGPCQRFGLYLESLKAKKKKGRLIVKDTGPAGFSPDGRRLAFVAGGALVLRGVSSTQQTAISTGGVVPATTGAPTWR